MMNLEINKQEKFTCLNSYAAHCGFSMYFKDRFVCIGFCAKNSPWFLIDAFRISEEDFVKFQKEPCFYTLLDVKVV